MDDQRFFNLIAATSVIVVLAAFGAGALGAQFGGGAAASAAPATTTSNLYLTIEINPVTGWPQYSPANFTVSRGIVHVTLIDLDAPGAWAGCSCNVTGTVGDVETVNGTTVSSLSSTNIAHSFDIPSLGINVVSPGMSTTEFTLDLNESGTFNWMCLAPCQYPPNGPMGETGYMIGAMTVT
ncbi:MAG: hypothetical protein L3K02_09410 [Thermoplasmata archaeon]|nr:hypothetical protein [Thermoplasmata archaeon]